MHASLPTFAVVGIDAQPISVESDCVAANSLDTAHWTVVGLGDAAVKESRERVKAALKNSGMGVSQRRVIINLAPADLRKEGSHYDLPIALSVLAGTERLPAERARRFATIGELGLDGGIRPVPGALSMAIGARDAKLDGLLVPKENAREASCVLGVAVHPVSSLLEAAAFLRGDREIPAIEPAADEAAEEPDAENARPDFSDVRGQENAKRALEIAAAGGHCVVLIGSPGSGKTMLARRLPTILPEMGFEEAIETTKIHSIAGRLNGKSGLMRERPFRAPHHTASHVALVGGGAVPRPGEVSLSHNGVLFLDEFPEFSRTSLEALRQPLEDRVVVVSRASMSLEFPASFILVAAMNPCPCGYATHPEKRCVCAPQQVQRYLSRISGPLLDRIDLHIDVTPVKVEELQKRAPGEPSSAIRERAKRAREIQAQRFAGRPGMHCNAQMTSRDLRRFCALEPEASKLLESAMKGLDLSARAYDRILKTSRTIADLDGAKRVGPAHISEAVQYRTLDRSLWT